MIFDTATFRSVLGRFVTGVTVITTVTPEGATAGVTVSSFNTLSLEPPLVLWSLALRAPSLAVFRSSGQFAVNILANDQKAIATQFATRAVDKFAGVDLIKGLGGLPLIAGAAAHLECEVEQRYPGGDHELIIGRVLHAVAHGQTPLVYAQGLFGDFLAASEEIGK